MGVFDFTYADTKENIMGRAGWIYLTRAFAQATNLPNPLPFESTDLYGRLDIHIHDQWMTLDVFALLGAMYLLNGEVSTVSQKESTALTNYMYHLRKQRYHQPTIDHQEDILREYGVKRFFESLKDGSYHHIVPLLITATKLEVSDEDVISIATNYGFVSGYDPNQGMQPTTNHIVRYVVE